MERRYRIGTSGWTYKHWRRLFYPEKLSQSKWLEFYSQHFDTVELNATFYRLPAASTFSGWRQRTPPNFCWAIKASRVITHYQKLRQVEEPLANLLDRAGILGDKLGPVLFQLPPSLAYDHALFEEFASLLDCVRLPVVEVRHRSWLNDRFWGQLQEHNIALCISDTAGRYPYAEEVTAAFVYVRLHGSRQLYASEYTEAELEAWAEKLQAWGRPAYVYFDNDYQGHAIKNAIRLKTLLDVSGD